MIDEIWESVRRSGEIGVVRDDHLQELQKRVEAVNEDPDIALTPAQARALLER